MRSLSVCAWFCLLLSIAIAAITVGAIAIGPDRLYQAQLLLLAPVGGLIICAVALCRRTRRMSSETADAVDAACSQQVAESYLSTIRSLVIAIDAKDSYTAAHTTRVQEAAEAIARQMKMRDSELEGIKTAALIHDIGKIGIPEHILRKPGKLTPEEFQAVKDHPVIGSQILGPVDFPWPIPAIVRGHHERWDGSGYPDGLRGEEIPLGARILAAADVFDALTSNRSYRDRLSPAEAVRQMGQLAGSHFDPAVVEALAAVYGQLENAPAPPVEKAEPEPKPDVEPAKRRGKSSLMVANQEILALSDITHTLTSALNPREVVSLVAGKVCAVLEADTCVVFLKDEADPDRLVADGASGVNARFFNGASAGVGDGITGGVAAAKRPYNGSYQKADVTLTASTATWTELRSCISAPITRGDTVFGAINAYLTDADGFSEEDVSLLMLMASRIAGALERASARIKAEGQGYFDALTGLLNTSSFFDALQKQLDAPERQTVSVLSISLDNFKSINETMGHHSGDRLLQAVGRLIRDAAGSGNPTARCAGDTFVAAVAGVDAEEAQRLAKRMEQCFAAYCKVSRIPSACKVSMSVGAAACPEDGTSAKSLVAVAETRQHEIKSKRKQAQQAAA